MNAPPPPLMYQSDSSGSGYLTPPVSPGRVRVHKTLSRTPSTASGPGDYFTATPPPTPLTGWYSSKSNGAAATANGGRKLGVPVAEMTTTRRPSFLEARLSALALGTLAISQQLVGGRPPAGLSAAAPGAAGWSASRQTSQVGQVGYTVYIRERR